MTGTVEHHGSFEKPKRGANDPGANDPDDSAALTKTPGKPKPILGAVTVDPSSLDARLDNLAQQLAEQGATIRALMAKADRWEQDFRAPADALSEGPIESTQIVRKASELGGARPFTGIIGGRDDPPPARLTRRATFVETMLRLIASFRAAWAASQVPGFRPEQSNAHGSAFSGTWRKPRFVVYTAIAGKYDKLRLPEKLSDDFDYVCFADSKPRRSGVWSIRHFDFLHEDPVRTARFVKLHPHIYFPDYEASLWIDGNLLIKGDISEFLEALNGESKIASFIHPHRNCVYDEASEIKARGKLDKAGLITRQMQIYESQKYPKNLGLVETGVLARRHNDPEIIQLMNAWWKEIDNGSRRDQLSLPFVCNALRIAIAPLAPRGISVRNDARIRRMDHGKKAKYRAPRRLRRMRPRDGAQEALNPQGLAIAPARVMNTDEASIHALSLDVIICVHNGLEYVKECLESIAPTLLSHHRIVIVDDGSDAETQSYLQKFAAKTPRCQIIRHEEAGGYTRAANSGVRASKADYVILLNSDTRVPPRWWFKLLEVGETAGDIGLVGPMSNAASWQSVPEILRPDGKLAVNSIPEGMSVSQIDDLIASCSTTHFPRVPLLNGFCLAIKRKVFDEIGEFDEKRFPRGYGEEDDFCFRATDAGFGLAVATHCYVFHAKSKSYTSAGRDEIAKESSQTFRAIYPKARIDGAIKTMKKNPLLKRMRVRLAEKLDARLGKPIAGSASRASMGDAPRAGKANDGSRRFGFFKGKKRQADLLRPDPSMMITTKPKAKTRDEALAFDLTPEQVEANRRVIEEFRANPRITPRRVLWFVPKFDNIIRGGIRTIFATAESFSRRWETHNIFVIYGGDRDLPRMEDDARETFPDLRFEFIALRNGDDPEDLPESDVAFCTLWTSAYLLVKYNRCRSKCYFVQDYEPLFHGAGMSFGFAQQSYRFGFTGIANTPGVADEYARFNPWVRAFTPAVDRTVFYPEAGSAGSRRPFRVVFYGRPTKARNAFHLGAEALRQVKERLGDRVEIISVGSEFSAQAEGLDGVLENWGMLETMEEVAALYRSSDVGLVFMFSAHPSYQPFEYMASGCATVSNFNPSNDWFFKNNENAVLADAVPSCVAEKILQLHDDPEFRARIVRGGLETVERFDWDHTFREIQDYVSNPFPRGESVENIQGAAIARNQDGPKADYWIDADPVAFRDWVVKNDFSFMDFGCSNGNSMLQAEKLFEVRTRGLGIDIDHKKLKTAAERGLTVAQFDIGTLPDEKIVDFVTMVHFIEHLDGAVQAKAFIEKACGIARDFIFIRQPYFDADSSLLNLGLKCYWSDWSGHRFHMTSLEMYALLRDLKIRGLISDYSIHFAYEISNSEHSAIIPLSAGADQFDYDSSIHPEKDSTITFDFPVFREMRVVISFDPDTQAKIENRVSKAHTLFDRNGELRPARVGTPSLTPETVPSITELAVEPSDAP